MGFNIETKLPRKQGGLLGVPRAFFGGIESQGKGTLHVHLVVFLAGFPNKVEKVHDKLLADDTFKQRVI